MRILAIAVTISSLLMMSSCVKMDSKVVVADLEKALLQEYEKGDVKCERIVSQNGFAENERIIAEAWLKNVVEKSSLCFTTYAPRVCISAEGFTVNFTKEKVVSNIRDSHGRWRQYSKDLDECDECFFGILMSCPCGVTLKQLEPIKTTQESSQATFVISNGLRSVITFFEVGDDGFGYDVEKLVDGNWRPSGVTWCGTGRKLIKLAPGKNYDFEARCEPKQERQRVALEYWVGEPLVTVPLTVVSEPFVLMPVDYDVAILYAVQTNVVSADSIKTNGVVKIDSSVVFPPMRGDPMRIDALTALILVTGGGFNDWNLRRSGIHCFAKKLGPFEYMEVKEFEPMFRRSLFEKNVLYGGQASQVVSTATVHSVSYGCAVSMVRRIGDSLKKELRAMRFVEEISRDVSFSMHSVEGRYGGWNVTIGFNGSEADGWNFQLKMERSRTNAPNRQEEIGVEVDL